jgi:hypothetical protein
MRLPENSHEFRTHVLDKLRVYCDAKIWPFEFDQFTRWLSNFDCKIEEYLALHLLDSLIVRSNDMAVASYERLFYGELRQHLIKNAIIESKPLKVWRDQLAHGYLCKSIKFIPVNMGEDGESGHVVYRMLSSFLNTTRYQLSPDEPNPDLKAIVIVDDVLGSGEQFLDFAEEFKLQEKLSNYQIIYCPLMACEDGITTVNQKFENLKILPAEHIPRSTHLFSEPLLDNFKKDLFNTKADAKAFLEQMKTKYAPRMDDWLDRNDASLCLAFQWGCPNQSPALLYMNRSNYRTDWNQLFQRRSM